MQVEIVLEGGWGSLQGQQLLPSLQLSSQGWKEASGETPSQPPHCIPLSHLSPLVLLLPFGLGIYLFVFLVFFPSFLLSRVAGRVLVLQPGVRPEPPRWESLVQDVGPPEISWPHVISISESSLRDLHLNTKTQLHPMVSKLQGWMPHAKQLARQEHNPTQ